MTSNPTLAKYVDRVSSLPPELELGFLFWFTVPTNFRMSHNEFVKLVKDVGLGQYTGLIPSEPCGPDVYRRALKTFERTEVVGKNQSVHKFLIRVFGDKHQIVREQAAPRGTKLTYKVLGDLSFDRYTETIIFTALEDGDPWMGKAMDIANDVRQYFRNWRHHINDNPVRYFLRGVFNEWDATCVRPSGGVYFAMPDYKGELGALSELCWQAGQASGSQTSLEIVPIPNDEKQKEMIRHAFEEESVGEAEKLIGEITEILADSSRNIRAGTFEQIHVRFLTLARKTVDYGTVMESEFNRVTSVLEILKGCMVPLSDRISGSD